MSCCRSGREHRWAIAWVGLVLSLGLTACTRQDFRVYDAPKERAPQRADLPAGWEETPGGGMRLSSYIVRGAAGEEAQVSVVPLPGASGSEIDNVNRWRNQLGLQAISEDDLPGQRQEVTVAGEPGRMYEMAGTADGEPTRTLAALLKHANSVWFFKMMGNDTLVKEQKAAFVKFIAQYEISHDDHSHDTPAPAAPPPVAATPSPTVGTNWAVPSRWQQVTPGPMVQAKYTIAEGKASVTLSILGGSGGALLPNVNRWRTEQLQLPPATEKDLETLAVPLDLPDAKGSLIDMRGPAQRMVAARIPRGDQTWYFKLMGEDSVVGMEKDAFIEFVKSAK